MNRLRRLTLTAATFSLVTLAGCGAGESTSEFDLQAVLDVTVDSLMQMEANAPEPRVNAAGEELARETDELLVGFAEVLEQNYNTAEPALWDTGLTVAPQENASFVAVADANGNGESDQDEDALWMIEIDGENARIIATTREGAVQHSGISGTSLLAGYFLGRMLTRQRASGVDTRALANKQAATPRQAARARAGSGSYARGM